MVGFKHLRKLESTRVRAQNIDRSAVHVDLTVTDVVEPEERSSGQPRSKYRTPPDVVELMCVPQPPEYFRPNSPSPCKDDVLAARKVRRDGNLVAGAFGGAVAKDAMNHAESLCTVVRNTELAGTTAVNL